MSKLENIIKDTTEALNDVSIGIIADRCGYERQKIKCMEELAELTQALAKDDVENITEEIADVEIMLAQIKYLLEINDSEIIEIKGDKLIRTLGKIRIEDMEEYRNLDDCHDLSPGNPFTETIEDLSERETNEVLNELKHIVDYAKEHDIDVHFVIEKESE